MKARVDLELAREFTDTLPAVPASGVVLFARGRARKQPAFMGPLGVDSRLQPFLGSNQVVRVNTIPGSATLQAESLTVTAVTTPAAVTPTTGSLGSLMTRVTYSTASATTGLSCGFRSAVRQFLLSTTPNAGGFHFVCRFVQANGSTVSGSRGLIGLFASTSAMAATSEPSTVAGVIGLGFDSGDSTMQFISNGSGTVSKTNTGFSKNGSNIPYEFEMFAPSGRADYVAMALTRLTDGVVARTEITNTAVLPPGNSQMAPVFHYGNGTSATVASISFQSLYIETDN